MTDKDDWKNYFEVTRTSPPSETAMCAMKENRGYTGLIIDLGCGAGTDSFYFLQNGWKVLAIDDNPEFLMASKGKLPEELQSRLQIEKMKFEDLVLPMAECIIANFSLPFCKPGRFKAMWHEIVKRIKGEGIFSGIFFGNRDAWAKRSQHVLEKQGFVYTHEDDMLRYYEIHRDDLQRHYNYDE